MPILPSKRARMKPDVVTEVKVLADGVRRVIVNGSLTLSVSVGRNSVCRNDIEQLNEPTDRYPQPFD